ncbi:MAG: HAD family hydrolase [Candidatus Aenigmarchaeota archaeon]|nr:HAD family hydrolase [Candidatus Aenigmarchaeota archaeon]
MEKFQDVRVVIFDYGNTLVFDPFEDILDRRLVKFVSSVVRKSENKVREAFIQANKEINYPYVTHFALEEPIVWRALEKLGVKPSESAFLALEIIKVYRTEYKKMLKSYKRKKEIENTLNYLRGNGKRLGVISNGRAIDLYSILEWLGIRKYFDFTISSEEAGVEKPDKRIFLKMLNFFKQKPEKCVYVGDDPLRDMPTPKKLGMKMILYKPPKRYAKTMPWRKYNVKMKEKPDLVIKNLTELKKIF